MMEAASEEELAEALAGAAGPLRIVGGGTRDVGRPVAGDALSVAGLRGITLYEPGALTLVARAGTPLAEVEAALAAEGQRLAFEPMDHRVLLGTKGAPTIGGVVAVNVSGPRRVQAGACRDFLLGVRFVDGAGRILKSGGLVMKNVTGYDLVKLMAGSWGTLGVITEVSFKVQAIPEAQATLLLRGLDAREGVAALSRGFATPCDVSAAAHALAGMLDEGALTALRLEGSAASVRERMGRLAEALGGPGWDVIEGGESADLWRRIRDVAPFAGREGALWRVSVKPTDGPALLEALQRAGQAHEALMDWGGGLVWLLVPEGGDAGAEAIRGALARLGGHARLERASADLRASIPVFQPEPEALARLSAGIRARFDPRGILNPGLMG